MHRAGAFMMGQLVQLDEFRSMLQWHNRFKIDRKKNILLQNIGQEYLKLSQSSIASAVWNFSN